MKIRFKNNNQLLNEGTVLNAQKPDNIAANSVQQQLDFTLMDRIAIKQFIQERKRELLPIDIAVPSDFYTPIMLKPGPQDLQVVMHTVQTNKARKTRDLEAWGMVDPISTFNNAEDCCQKIFNSFFGGPIQLAQSKAEMKANKQDIKDSNESLAYESVSYDYYKPLNESAALTGLALGNIAGSLAGAGVNFLGAMGAGFAVSVAPAVGAIMVSTDLIGKAGQKIFGDTDRNDRNTNDEVAAHLNTEQIAQSVTQTPLNGNGDIVAAIDNYIKEMLQAGRELLTGISSSMGKKYTTEFENFIVGCQSELAEKMKDFIQENSKQIQQEKELRERVRTNKLQSWQNNKMRCLKLIEALTKYIPNANSSDANIISSIINDLSADNKNGKKILDNWDDNTDNVSIMDIITNYKTNKSNNKQNKEQNSSISNDFDMSMRLNEDNTEQTGRIDINLENIYKILIKDLKQRINEIIDEFDPKNMVNLAETKQTMEDLIKAADETIKNKIQIITKANVSPAASKESGLGAAAIQFLAGHPIEANNLTEVWSRHLADLKTRMNNRIKIMTDANNPVRTLGWTLNMCRTVFPEFFARMLTYRYAYALLTNNGIYSYDTAQAAQDISIFNAQDPSTGQSFRDAYVSSARAEIIYVLNNYGSEYTAGDSTFIDVDEDGGYKLNGNTIRYGSLMLHRIAGNNLTTDDKLVGGMAFANLSNDNKGLEHLIDVLYGNMTLSGLDTHRLLMVQIENLVQAFRLPQELQQSKDLIKNTYSTIINEICSKANNIDNDKRAKQIADSLYIINTVGPREIYRVYKSNESKLLPLMEAFENANYGIFEGSEDNENKDKLTNIKNDVNKYFANITFPNLPENTENSYKEAIKTVFSTDENKAKNDYYAYILSWYSNKDALAGTVLSTTIGLFAPDEIKNVCEMTPPLLRLAVSGLLAYAMKEDKKDENNKEKEIVNIFQEIKPYCEEIKNASFNKTTIDTLNGSNPVADNAKKEYIKHYKAVINHISEKYKDLTNKELNITKLAVIINKIVSYDDKGQYKVVVDILKDIIFEKDSNKKFGELNLDERYNILNNLRISIESIKDLVEWQELTAAINKLKEFAEESEESNTYPQLNSNSNNESIIYFNDKQYNIVNNIYVLNEDNNENINNTESTEIEKGINVISKNENKAKEILAILKGEKDNSQSTEQINNEEIIKSLDNMTKIITSFSL